jgi:hypothetical protein
MTTAAELQRFIRSILDMEAASGYPVLRRIPSTDTWKILDYISALGPAERDALFTAFAGHGVFLLRPDRDPTRHAYQAGHPAYRRFVEAMPRRSEWTYTDVRMLRGILGDLRSRSPSSAWADVPADVLRRADAIQPTKATAIRQEIERLFAQRFGARAENRGGGAWVSVGAYQSRVFQVGIDYGA